MWDEMYDVAVLAAFPKLGSVRREGAEFCYNRKRNHESFDGPTENFDERRNHRLG